MHDAVALPSAPAVATAVMEGALDEELQAASSKQATESRKANR
jgi:hypothetical protein